MRALAVLAAGLATASVVASSGVDETAAVRIAEVERSTTGPLPTPEVRLGPLAVPVIGALPPGTEDWYLVGLRAVPAHAALLRGMGAQAAVWPASTPLPTLGPGPAFGQVPDPVAPAPPLGGAAVPIGPALPNEQPPASGGTDDAPAKPPASPAPPSEETPAEQPPAAPGATEPPPATPAEGPPPVEPPPVEPLPVEPPPAQPTPPVPDELPALVPGPTVEVLDPTS